MKLTHKTTLILLYILTTATALASAYLYGWRYFVLVVLGLSAIKFLLVAFDFMEMKKAHAFWQFFIVTFVLVFVGTVSLILG